MGNNDGDGHDDGKPRMPWWTDRVFCKITPASKPDSGNGVIDRTPGTSAYKCLFNIEGSDHRPVMATFVIGPPRIVDRSPQILYRSSQIVNRRRLQDGETLPTK